MRQVNRLFFFSSSSLEQADEKIICSRMTFLSAIRFLIGHRQANEFERKRNHIEYHLRQTGDKTDANGSIERCLLRSSHSSNERHVARANMCY